MSRRVPLLATLSAYSLNPHGRSFGHGLTTVTLRGSRLTEVELRVHSHEVGDTNQ
jgi:hypothetical protein